MREKQDLYTVSQAACVLQVSRSTMYRLIRDCDIESIQIRGTRRIRPAAIERFLNRLQRDQREREVKFD